jgi:hypothetical protein
VTDLGMATSVGNASLVVHGSLLALGREYHSQSRTHRIAPVLPVEQKCRFGDRVALGQARTSVLPPALLLKWAPVIQVTAALQCVESFEMRPHERTTRVSDLPMLNAIVD